MNDVAAASLANVPLAGFASSPIAGAIRAIYQVGGALNEWVDEHIEALKRSDNPLIASTGRVLEGAKFGFGLGYIASTALIAVGQYLLGNTFAAVATVGAAAVLSNPIAMTCGALGAIYFGWAALTDKEREQILERLSDGLTLGVELLRALVNFAIRKSRDLLNAKQLENAKTFIKSQAESFGRTLYDVTRQVGDLTSETVDALAHRAGEAASVIKEAAGKFGDAVASGASSAAETLKSGALMAGETFRDGVDAAGNLIKVGTSRVGALATDACASLPGDEQRGDASWDSGSPKALGEAPPRSTSGD